MTLKQRILTGGMAVLTLGIMAAGPTLADGYHNYNNNYNNGYNNNYSSSYSREVYYKMSSYMNYNMSSYHRNNHNYGNNNYWDNNYWQNYNNNCNDGKNYY